MCFRHQPGWVCVQPSEVVTVGSTIAGSATNNTLIPTQSFIITQDWLIDVTWYLKTRDIFKLILYSSWRGSPYDSSVFSLRQAPLIQQVHCWLDKHLSCWTHKQGSDHQSYTTIGDLITCWKLNNAQDHYNKLSMTLLTQNTLSSGT